MRTSFRISLLFISFGGIGFILSVAFWLVNSVIGHRSWPKDVEFVPVVFVILLVAFLPVLAEFRIWRRGGKYAVYLYEHGLIYSFLWQDKQYLDVVTWEHVGAIWPTWTRAKGCIITYEEVPGEEGLMRLTGGIKDSALLIQEIQTQIVRVKLPKYIEDFQREEVCSFPYLLGWDDHKTIVRQGVLITPQGLTYKRRILHWNDVAAIERKGEKVVIMPRKGSPSSKISLSIHQIANAEVLVGLVSHILKQRSGES